MTKRTRRTPSPRFEATAALVATKGALAELAKRFDVHLREITE
ncbi:hypothetical protein [Falsiroseomonas sp.]